MTPGSGAAGTGAPAEALSLHGRLIGGSTAARSVTGAAALFGDQVLGDLRLVEVVIVGDRRA